MSDLKLPVNAAEYPKTTAARLAMTDIAARYMEEYAQALDCLGAEDRMQKKALSIQLHMAQHCHTFAAMGYNSSLWEEQIARRTSMLKRSRFFGEYASALSDLSEDERGAFIQYVHTAWMLHNAFIDKHLAHLRAVIDAGQPEKAFEDRIILGTVYAICREWRQWWTDNGPIPFEHWTYEDLPFPERESEADHG